MKRIFIALSIFVFSLCSFCMLSACISDSTSHPPTDIVTTDPVNSIEPTDSVEQTESTEPAEPTNLIDTIEIGDTLGYTQAEYLELIHANYDGSIAQMRSSTLEKDLIQNICSVFIAIGRASVRNTDYDCMVLVNQESQTDKTILYRVSEYEYLNAMNQALNYEILSDELVLSDFNVSIAEDSATVNVVESYTYDITDGFEGESFCRRQYYFTLVLDESGWSITSVTTNDFIELTDEFEYEPIDIESAIRNLTGG